jgi:hypothetical protein
LILIFNCIPASSRKSIAIQRTSEPKRTIKPRKRKKKRRKRREKVIVSKTDDSEDNDEVHISLRVTLELTTFENFVFRTRCQEATLLIQKDSEKPRSQTMK